MPQRDGPNRKAEDPVRGWSGVGERSRKPDWNEWFGNRFGLNAFVSYAMRASLRKLMLANIAVVAVAATLILWPRPSPVSLIILSMEPSGMVDDAGAEFTQADVVLRNATTAGVLMDHVHAEAYVAGRWLTAPQPWLLRRVPPNGEIKELALIPNGAESYRLKFRYARHTDHWELRLYNWVRPRLPSVFRIGVIGTVLSRRHENITYAKPRPPQRTGWRVHTVEVQITERVTTHMEPGQRQSGRGLP
jgi:hypothetical protein